MRVLISGGGTGGHIYPAIAIADALKAFDSNIEILFVGANGRMEMTKVPKAGYTIEGLDISGLQRKLTFKNLSFPVKVFKSLMKSNRIIRDFKPDVGVGVGGYASGPAMFALSGQGLPLVLQEQNSYPGITNKILARKASKICVAYPGMDKFFPSNVIEFTGNPIRKDLEDVTQKRAEGMEYFGLDASKKTCLVVGGSLGARTLNQTMDRALDKLKSRDDIQWIWQYGGGYVESFGDCASTQLTNVNAMPFIDRMDLAYAVADVVVARAGALTVSELSMVGVPSILVPSPHVAEDHQTKNAMALVSNDAALYVKDSEATQVLVDTAFDLIDDTTKQQQLRQAIANYAKPNAAEAIARMVINLASKN